MIVADPPAVPMMRRAPTNRVMQAEGLDPSSARDYLVSAIVTHRNCLVRISEWRMSDGDQLRDLLAEFAHTLAGDFKIQEILDHLVRRIVDVLPVTGSGVMLMGPSTK